MPVCIQPIIDTINSNRTEITKSWSAPSIIKITEKQRTKPRIFSAKPTKANVMPCYRYIKSGMIKNEVSPVKKIVLRSTMGPKIKTFVGSGVSHKQQNDTKTDVTNKKCYNMSDVAVKKLAQPEYNSVMYTLDKLKEIKEQKIVRNINHLPPMQKNLLNGKVKFLSRHICLTNTFNNKLNHKTKC